MWFILARVWLPALLEAEHMLFALTALEHHDRMGPTMVADAGYCGGPDNAKAGQG